MAIQLAAGWARGKRLMAVSRDGFWEYRPKSDEGWYSSRVLEQLGWPAGRARSGRCTLKQAERLVHPEDLRTLRQLLRRAKAGDAVLVQELRLHLPGRPWRWMRAHVQRGADEHGALLLYGTLQDIHDEKTATLALESLVRDRTASLEHALALAEQRRQQAEAADSAKTHFLAQVSHEIRTPLTGVLGMIELARRTPLNRQQQRYLDTADDSARALQHVISDLLDLSRIESGQVELAQESFDPARVMAHALRSVLSMHTASALSIVFDWEGDTPCLRGDPGALRQIATNLLTNAVKFTASGQVSLQGDCRLLPGEPGQARLTLKVRDTGPGIDPSQRERIFEPFVQGGQQPVRGVGGAGLGLAIARRLSQAMGATLQLECPPEGGSAFTLTLTLPTVADPRRAVSPAPVPLPAGATAWLVHGNASMGPWLGARLARLGWASRLFAGLDQALRAVQTGGGARPGMLVIGQSALGDVGSLAVLHEALPDVPVRLIVQPGWNQPALEAEAHAMGLPILVAPLTPAQLQRLHTGQVTLPDEDDDRRVASPPAPDRQPEVLLVEDNPLNLLVGREYLQSMGLAVREAATGASALASCLARPPALVLLDLQLPDMDGLEVSRRLRALQQQGAWPGAPIVALTAHGSTQDRRACRAAGMDGLMTKPMTLNKLQRRLTRWVRV